VRVISHLPEVEAEAASFIIRNYYDPRKRRIKAESLVASMSLLALVRLAKNGIFEDAGIDDAAAGLWKELERSVAHWNGVVGDLSSLLLALMEWHHERAPEKDASPLKSGLELLRDFIWTKTDRSFERLEPTGLAIMAMSGACQLGYASEKELGRAQERAENIIRKAQNLDGGWGFGSYESSPAPTSLALIALTASGRKREDSSVRTGTRWLLAHQAKDGSWNASIETFLAQSEEVSVPWFSTPYAVRALAHSRVPGAEIGVVSGIRYLISTQSRGGWSSLPSGGGTNLRNSAEALLAMVDLASTDFKLEKIMHYALEHKHSRYRMILQVAATLLGLAAAILGSYGGFGYAVILIITALAGSVAAVFSLRPR